MISTPNALPADQAIAAAWAQSQVVCDKPLATSVDAATCVLQAAESANITLRINFQTRYFRPFLEAREAITSNPVGEVRPGRRGADRLSDADILMVSPTPTVAPPLSGDVARVAYIPYTTLGACPGVPALSLPAGFGADDLPVAVKLLPASQVESTLLGAALLLADLLYAAARLAEGR